MNSREQLKQLVDQFNNEMASFEDKGKKVAGRRARKILQEMGKFVKETRKSISDTMKTEKAD
jgi:hypothetical protein